MRALTRLICILLLTSWYSGTALGVAQGALDDEQRVLMCTQNGYEWVTISQNEGSTPLATSQHCVFCLLSDVDTALGPDAYSSATFFDSSPLVLLRVVMPERARASFGHWQINRAPPL